MSAQMKTQSHTPGPWYVQDEAAGIVNVGTTSGGVAVVKNISNAKLIAAAPDLAEALQRLVRQLKTNPGVFPYPEFIDAQSALAKAGVPRDIG